MTTFNSALQHAQTLDAQDPLAHKRDEFSLPEGVIYLDGNSLGALPKTVAPRMQQAIQTEWGVGLIRSWNDAHWYPAPQRVGGQIAALIGAKAHEVITCDSTTVNLFKVLCAASLAQPERKTLICEEGNFPTDAYITESTAALYGKRILLANQDTIEQVIAQAGQDLCAVALTHVHYKTGRMLDMARITRLVQQQGGRMIWDLAHSAGVIPVELNKVNADYAVGCGYKYLNGGPGAPAFVWAHPRHVNRFWQPLAGWFGHAAPFEFSTGYQPAPGITRFQCGTPPVLSLAALECGVDTVLAAQALGGMSALRNKSLALTRQFAQQVLATSPGLKLASPSDDSQRGSQVCFAHPEIGYPVMQALIARGVIGDFRAPDILRFGFTPLYLRHVDVWDAAEQLRQVLASGEWQRPEFNQRQAVT